MASCARATWLTDLHLNFLESEALDRFLATVEGERPEVIFVTGDTGESQDVLELVEQLSQIAPVYFVLGNHDFYRSSIAEVRERAIATKRWLPALGPVHLTESTALVGVDGWGDARCGNLESPVRLADWMWIRELEGLLHCSSAHRVETLRRIGVDEATTLERHLGRLEPTRELVVLTHVPPFAEACWHDGKQSSPDWLPWFTCIAVGEVLRDHALQHPATRMTVLCGHTHGRGEYQVSENLVVRTGGWAPGENDYGNPIVQASWLLT